MKPNQEFYFNIKSSGEGANYSITVSNSNSTETTLLAGSSYNDELLAKEKYRYIFYSFKETATNYKIQIQLDCGKAKKNKDKTSFVTCNYPDLEVF